MKYVSGILLTLVALLILGTVVANTWDTFLTAGAGVAALTDTSAGTVILQALWVVVPIVVGCVLGYKSIKAAMQSFKK